ncbi:MAG: hypothetical protein ABEI27_14930, partial [Halobellus sp.]|uniref:hypothetical protein n=1 Tax=Halobellus sp. TaxID=1979212 RepID=UPI0035D3F2CF
MSATSDKERVHALSQTIHEATPETAEALVSEYYHDDAVLRGPAPLDDCRGVEGIAERFWEPILTAFPDLEKNNYILFGGE